MCRSSTEAEIHAANEACSDVLHAVDLHTDIGHPQKPVVFYEDNQAEISLMLKSDFNNQTKSKHIHVRYDFLKEQVRNNVIVFRYSPTELQPADIFTKPIIGERFFHFRDCLIEMRCRGTRRIIPSMQSRFFIVPLETSPKPRYANLIFKLRKISNFSESR